MRVLRVRARTAGRPEPVQSPRAPRRCGDGCGTAAVGTGTSPHPGSQPRPARRAPQVAPGGAAPGVGPGRRGADPPKAAAASCQRTYKAPPTVRCSREPLWDNDEAVDNRRTTSAGCGTSLSPIKTLRVLRWAAGRPEPVGSPHAPRDCDDGCDTAAVGTATSPH